MKRLRGVTALLVCLNLIVSYAASAEGVFRYRHDPRLNAYAMADVTVDAEAVYGFRPREDGSLKNHLGLDWHDEEAVNGEDGRQSRLAYHDSLADMYAILNEMTDEGRSIEDIARAVSAKRNELRFRVNADDPEKLAAVKARNLEKYGHEDGPHADEMYEKYGSWEIIIDKAFSTNAGLDACVGLYDEQYPLYVAAGQLKEEAVMPAAREYAVAAFIDALTDFRTFEDTAALDTFADAADVKPYFAPECAYAASCGVLRGYEDGSLRPEATVTLAEAIVIAARILDLQPEGAPAVSFTDVPDFAREAAAAFVSAGVIAPREDGSLGAEAPLTVEAVVRLAEKIKAFAAD